MADSIMKYRGVIEGFYGPMWTHEDRLHLIRHMSQWRMNLYIYSPRDDPYHRFHWDSPYPDAEMARFTELAEAARSHDVQFAYAISPGNTFEPHNPAHRETLLRKLDPFIQLGSTFFPIFYDDLVEQFDPASEAGERHAEQQAQVMNELADAIAARCPDARFLFCPTHYMTAEKLPYLVRLHEQLDPRIETAVTGVDPDCGGIVPRTFSDDGARRYHANFNRRPFFWDNFHVHDIAVNVLHWTPYMGRGTHLHEICSGIVLNPLNVYLLNLPIFGCMGDYLADPFNYDPHASFQRHLTELMGEDGAKLGMVLSKWYTAEWADYRSSDENLPSLEGNRLATADGRKAVLTTIYETFDPLTDFGERFNRTRMPPEVAARLLPFANLLQAYARVMVAFCQPVTRAATSADVDWQSAQEGLYKLERDYYRLPQSLLDYAKQLYAACGPNREGA